MAPMIKLKDARKASVRPLGAVDFLRRSQPKDTKYEEEAAAIAGKNQVSKEKIISAILPPSGALRCRAAASINQEYHVTKTSGTCEATA